MTIRPPFLHTRHRTGKMGGSANFLIGAEIAARYNAEVGADLSPFRSIRRYPNDIDMTDNLFQPPSNDANREPPPKRQRIPKTRPEMAGKLCVSGCLGGALVGTVGFLVLIAAIELLLTPPLKWPPNYGQFGIIVIGVGFYAALFGVCLGIVPYVSWVGYIPVHLLGISLIWSMEKQFFADVDWTEAPIVAMLAIFTLPTPFAVWVSLWANRYQRIPYSG